MVDWFEPARTPVTSYQLIGNSYQLKGIEICGVSGSGMTPVSGKGTSLVNNVKKEDSKEKKGGQQEVVGRSAGWGGNEEFQHQHHILRTIRYHSSNATLL